jgi:hypothetical protein
LTLTVLPLGADSVTVKVRFVVPLLPSVAVTSSIERLGASSSSVMVTVPTQEMQPALFGVIVI